MVLSCDVTLNEDTLKDIIWAANKDEIISLIEAIEEKFAISLTSTKQSILSSSESTLPTFTSDFY